MPQRQIFHYTHHDNDCWIIQIVWNNCAKKNFFDTSHVEEVIELVLEVNPDAVMVIKSTIPVGYTKHVREKFSYRERQADGSFKEDVPVLFMGTTEAEAVKLFANTYLALRVSFFNELDTYAEMKGLDTQSQNMINK